MTINNDKLTIEEINKKMQTHGFPEMAWLFEKFCRLKKIPDSVDDKDLDCARINHMGGLTSYPGIMLSISIIVACLEFLYLKKEVLPGNWSSVGDYIMAVLLSVMTVYLFWFFITMVHRNFMCPWKKISALDLGSMLSCRNYMQTLNHTSGAGVTVEKLKTMGVTAAWDDPAYRVWYKNEDGIIQKTGVVGSSDFIQSVLRDLMGSKEDRKFKPGRFVDSLKSRKKSVTRFIKAYGESVNRNKVGDLSRSDGIAMLKVLKETEVKPGSPGDTFLEEAVATLTGDIFLPGGVVEAFIWPRDPWVDLTHSRDFFSSASLRANGFIDMLERRSKGMLGPFGYLRNKSISALDFRTAEGRSVRARLAAAVYLDKDGYERPLLFVDAVEGRFDIKPALIRKAVEDYAAAVGFDMVFYYRFPLNQVPVRFVDYLAEADLPLEELSIAYADASHREYLDVFGFPFEPFEYAYPKGKVIGFVAAVSERAGARQSKMPGKIKMSLKKASARGLLWSMVIASFGCCGWILYRMMPEALLPAGICGTIVIIYDLFIHRRIRRRVIDAEKRPGR